MTSVQFKEQVTRTAEVATPVLPKGKEDLVHEIGNALTQGAGPSGYLAVSFGNGRGWTRLIGGALGVYQTAAKQSAANQDVDVGISCGFTGVYGVLDCS
jgi:hypothetical protein